MVVNLTVAMRDYVHDCDELLLERNIRAIKPLLIPAFFNPIPRFFAQKSRRKIMDSVELRNTAWKLFCKQFVRNGEPILQTGNCEMPVRDLILQLVGLSATAKNERFNS